MAVGMFSKSFLRDTAERAVRAFAWSVLSVFTVAQGFNAFRADWADALGVGVGAAVLSLLASLAASHVGDPRSASLLDPTDPPGKHAADR